MGMRDWEREGGGEEKIQSTSVDYFCLFPLLLTRIFCRKPITLYACIMDTLAKEFQFGFCFTNTWCTLKHGCMSGLYALDLYFILAPEGTNEKASKP